MIIATRAASSLKISLGGYARYTLRANRRCNRLIDAVSEDRSYSAPDWMQGCLAIARPASRALALGEALTRVDRRQIFPDASVMATTMDMPDGDAPPPGWPIGAPSTPPSASVVLPWPERLARAAPNGPPPY